MFNRKNWSLLILLLFLVSISAGFLHPNLLKGIVSGKEKLPVSGTPHYQVASKSDVHVEVIIDVSGSMWGQFKGVNKIVNSKGVLAILVKDFPPDVKLGVRTFGGEEETRLEIPVGLDNREEIESIMKQLRPSGKSPIGYALEEAGKDLRSLNGKRYIILVSDGIDNGKVDPITKASMLRKDGIITHVVYVRGIEGFGEDKLNRLAEAGGGHFFTVDEKDLVVPTMTLTR